MFKNQNTFIILNAELILFTGENSRRKNGDNEAFIENSRRKNGDNEAFIR